MYFVSFILFRFGLNRRHLGIVRFLLMYDEKVSVLYLNRTVAPSYPESSTVFRIVVMTVSSIFLVGLLNGVLRQKADDIRWLIVCLMCFGR